MERRNEPSTEEIVRALRCDGCKGTCSECFFGLEEKDTFGYDTWGCRRAELDNTAADRLESLTREIAERDVKIEQLELQRDILAGAVKEMEEPRTFSSTELIITDPRDELIASLTARAEQAERERDAAIADMKLIGSCEVCFYEEQEPKASPCRECLKDRRGLKWFKWRGQQDGERKI